MPRPTNDLPPEFQIETVDTVTQIDSDIAAILEPETVDAPAPAAHPILTPQEVEEAKAEARAKIEAQRKKQAKARIIEEETQRLKTEDGLTTGDGVKDQMVRIALDLAPHTPYIAINSVPYYHGNTYVVPRHVADTLREAQQRGWRHQDEIDGKSLTQHYQRVRQSTVSAVKGVNNAPQKVA
jgi:hypothetical protein